MEILLLRYSLNIFLWKTRSLSRNVIMKYILLMEYCTVYYKCFICAYNYFLKVMCPHNIVLYKQCFQNRKSVWIPSHIRKLVHVNIMFHFANVLLQQIELYTNVDLFKGYRTSNSLHFFWNCKRKEEIGIKHVIHSCFNFQGNFQCFFFSYYLWFYLKVIWNLL